MFVVIRSPDDESRALNLTNTYSTTSLVCSLATVLHHLRFSVTEVMNACCFPELALCMHSSSWEFFHDKSLYKSHISCPANLCKNHFFILLSAKLWN